jgi:prepilin-type processing-associated H-X9-DG protein
MGGSDPRGIGAPVGGGWLTGSYNGSQTTWRTYGKLSSFAMPGAANTWVTMDENPYSINDGSLAIPANATAGNTFLVDFPAGNHNASAGIAFADGHALVHKWQDSLTYTPKGYSSPAKAAHRQTSRHPTTRIASIWDRSLRHCVEANRQKIEVGSLELELQHPTQHQGKGRARAAKRREGQKEQNASRYFATS